MSKKPRVSLVINTRNEAAHIADCIHSVGSFAHEIIVMDMESTDDTRKIAKKLGARVFSHPQMGYVEPARQAALEKASGEWILLLDADETVTPELKRVLRKIIKSDDHDIVAIPRKNNIFSQWLTGAGYWPNYQVRFFKKGAVTWTDVIHSAPSMQTEPHELPAKEALAIQHTPTLDPDHFLTKTDSYTNYETAFLSHCNTHGFTGTAILGYLEPTFDQVFFEQDAKRDKLAGFMMSKLMETYRFAEVAKYWLRHETPEIADWERLVESLEEEREFKRSIFFKVWRKLRRAKKKVVKLITVSA